MSNVIEVKQNPDRSWTAKGGSSITVVSVTCLTRHRAATCLDAALTAITQISSKTKQHANLHQDENGVRPAVSEDGAYRFNPLSGCHE